MAEGGGFLARDTPLREQAKNLGEGAVHASGGGEVAAGGKEFGKIECGANDVTSGCRIAKQLFFSLGVESAERGMNFGARHAALAPVGEGKLAALGQWIGVYEAVIAAKLRRGPSLTLFARDDHPGRMVELAAVGQCVGRSFRAAFVDARKLLIAMTFARRVNREIGVI